MNQTRNAHASPVSPGPEAVGETVWPSPGTDAVAIAVFAFAAVAVALGAVVVLAGFAGVPGDAAAGVANAPMRVNAAIGLLLDGIALALVPRRGAARAIVLPAVGLLNIAAAVLALAA
jgi:hypothetical protein